MAVTRFLEASNNQPGAAVNYFGVRAGRKLFPGLFLQASPILLTVETDNSIRKVGFSLSVLVFYHLGGHLGVPSISSFLFIFNQVNSPCTHTFCLILVIRNR